MTILPILPIEPDVLTYIVPWDDRVAFVSRVCGWASAGRREPPMRHPADPEKFASEARVTMVGGGLAARVDVTFRGPDSGQADPCQA